MKLLLLPALFMCCLFASSQNQLISYAEYDFYAGINEYENEIYIEYIYNDQDDFITDFNEKIKLNYETGDYDFQLPWELIKPDTTYHFSSFMNPDSILFITAYTYLNDLLVQTESFPNRTLYTYTPFNKEESVTKQFFDGTQYKTIDSIAKTYTSSNDLQTKHQFTSYNDTLRLMNVDTLIYNQITNKLEHFNHWGFSTTGTILEASRKDYYYTNTLYTIDYFTFDTITLNYNWTQQKNIQRSNYEFIGYRIHNVISNQVETSPFFSSSFYNSFHSKVDTLYGTETHYTDFYNTLFYNIEFEDIGYYTWDHTFIKGHAKSFEFNGVNQLIEFPNIQAKTIPNPATDVVTIKTETPIISLKLLTLTGQVILEQTTTEIDLNGLPAGTYLVTGQTERGNFNEKIIKQ